ncbi:MAG: SDR family oxidoreductase, partial [Acidimicrobiales bacterium]
ASVGLIARGRDGLEAAARDVEEAGGTALILPCDVASAEAVEEAASQAEAGLGPVDVWVNNAMATVYSPVWDLTTDEFRRATEVTYLGTVWGTMAAVRRMKARDRGVIVQVGSALSYRAIPLQSAYCGAKFAARGFTDAVRTELIHERSRVRITSVHLPAVNTPQFSWDRTKLSRHPRPVAPAFQPEPIAEATWKAAHSRRREVWPTRRATLTIVGSKFLQWPLDLCLGRTGFDAQQTPDEPVDPNRSDNLDSPVDEDHDFGGHGIFDDQSRSEIR